MLQPDWAGSRQMLGNVARPPGATIALLEIALGQRQRPTGPPGGAAR
ncbi:hypothetical protein [Nonomuraea sp. NPDC050202]